MAAPQQIPVAIHKARGTYRESRHGGQLEIEPPKTKPRMPSWIAPGAKKWWKKLSGPLFDYGLLTEADIIAVGTLCDLLSQYEEAQALIAEHGYLAESQNGSVYQHPAVGIANKTRKDILQWCREFGMTPSSRSKIAVNEREAQGSIADELFNLIR